MITTPSTAATMPKSGKRIGHGAQCLHRLGGVVMMHVHIEFHHLVEIEGFDAAADRHAHGVADEIANVMIFQKAGYFEKIGLLAGSSMSASSATSPSLRAWFSRSYIIFSVSRYRFLVNLLPPKTARESAGDLFQNMQRIGHQHGADGRPADDDQFGRLHQHLEVAVLHQISGSDGAEYHQNSNNCKHYGLSLLYSRSMRISQV